MACGQSSGADGVSSLPQLRYLLDALPLFRPLSISALVAHSLYLLARALASLVRSLHSCSNLILNSSDRALRVLTVSPQTGALAPIHRFQDLVNRTPWHAVGFSGDGEYVFGGAGHKMSHNVFVWDREAGALVKVLEGPKESLMDADVSGASVRAHEQTGNDKTALLTPVASHAPDHRDSRELGRRAYLANELAG